MTSPSTPTCIALASAGVSLVLDLSGGRLPAVLHWGAALRPLDDDDALALVEATRPVPAASTGRRPGPGRAAAGALDRLDGTARAQRLARRRAWSPKFAVGAATLDGDPT